VKRDAIVGFACYESLLRYEYTRWGVTPTFAQKKNIRSKVDLQRMRRDNHGGKQGERKDVSIVKIIRPLAEGTALLMMGKCFLTAEMAGELWQATGSRVD
jgi:hypothetical protein